MSQPTPEAWARYRTEPATESPVQLWISLWQAQLITHSR